MNRDQLGPCSLRKKLFPIGFTTFALCALNLLAAGPVPVGAKVTFTATAEGTTPITFEWFKDGVKIGEGPTLVIAYAVPENSGNYKVKATNIAGSADSQVEVLEVVQHPPPIQVTAPVITDVKVEKVL